MRSFHALPVPADNLRLRFQVAQFVEFGIVTFIENAAITHDHGRIFHQRFIQLCGQFWIFAKALGDVLPFFGGLIRQ